LELRNFGFDTSTGAKPLVILNCNQLNLGWIEVKDPEERELLLRTYFDQINSKILKTCTKVPRNIMDIIRHSGLPQTTAYRKILGLIQKQFLVNCDIIQAYNEHIIPRYIAAIKNFQIQVNDFEDPKIKVILNDPSKVIR